MARPRPVEEEEGVEARELPATDRVLPINTRGFLQYLSELLSTVTLTPMPDERLPEQIKRMREEAEVILRLAADVSNIWMDRAALPLPVAERGAFVTALRHRLATTVQMLKRYVEESASSCEDLLARLEAGEGRSIEELGRVVDECMRALKAGQQAVFAYLIALARITGAAQLSLPMELMSNVIKGAAGFFT